MKEFLKKEYSTPEIIIEEMVLDIITTSPTTPGLSEDEQWEGPRS